MLLFLHFVISSQLYKWKEHTGEDPIEFLQRDCNSDALRQNGRPACFAAACWCESVFTVRMYSWNVVRIKKSLQS